MAEQNGNDFTEARRRELFEALVRAQDGGLSPSESRKLMARQFGVSETQVRGVEREGLDGEWPPL